MIYYGPPITLDNNITTTNNPFHKPVGDEIVVMQQHCGGENLVVFKGLVNPNGKSIFFIYLILNIIIQKHSHSNLVVIKDIHLLLHCISMG